MKIWLTDYICNGFVIYQRGEIWMKFERTSFQKTCQGNFCKVEFWQDKSEGLQKQ